MQQGEAIPWVSWRKYPGSLESQKLQRTWALQPGSNTYRHPRPRDAIPAQSVEWMVIPKTFMFRGKQEKHRLPAEALTAASSMSSIPCAAVPLLIFPAKPWHQGAEESQPHNRGSTSCSQGGISSGHDFPPPQPPFPLVGWH